MDVTLRPLVPDDIEALRARFNALVAPAPGWTAAEAHAVWLSAAQGDRGRVAVRDGRVVGGVSAVLAPPWLYVFPLVAADADVAAVLLADGVGWATADVTTIRLGVRGGEDAKRAAALAAGFTPSITFVDLVHALTPAPELDGDAAAPPGLHRVAHAAIARAATHALHDRVFAEISNTAPTADADFAELLDGPSAWPAATMTWSDAAGVPRGFVIGQRGEDERGRFGVHEAVGVDPAWRGHGLARRMLDALLAQARADGLAEVRALVAGDNPGSLALHRAAGFVERGRRQMYDRPYDRPYGQRP